MFQGINQDALEQAFEHDPSMPGKFEGEPAYVVYYWHCMLDGDGEEGEDDEDSMRFEVNESELRMFPELDGSQVIEIWFPDSGFVYSALYQCK